jgi:PilZ domain
LAITERRSRQRYQLKLPLSVRPSGARPAVEILTECRDVSSHGVFFFLQQPLKSGSFLDIVLTLPSEITRGEPVRVHCEARVQRAETLEAGRVGIAAKIERHRFFPGKRDYPRAG